MKPPALLIVFGIGVAACAADALAQPQLSAPLYLRARLPGPTCTTADLMLGSVIARNATRVQAPKAEQALLPALQKARDALRATPCDKEGAIAALSEFKAAVDARSEPISESQVVAFETLADRIIAVIGLVP
jgi:hypothetical protein